MTSRSVLQRASRGVRTVLRSRRFWIALGVTILSVALAAAGLAYRVAQRLLASEPHPESATGLRSVEPTHFERAVVVAAHPDAADEGASVLARGGSALDAAVAVQLTLTLVEPQSSGIGGGGFLLYHDARTGRLHAYDGRETAPGEADASLFMTDSGQAMRFLQAAFGGRAVGVPGVVRLLELAHGRHGRLGWADIISGPVARAERGFRISQRLHRLIELDPILPAMPETRGYFFSAEGRALPVGARRDNAPLAAVLSALGTRGADAFYRGPIAEDLVAAVRTARRPALARGVLNLALSELGLTPGGAARVEAAGRLSVADLEAYRALERAPVCRVHRGRYRVCGMPPPSSGGIAVLQVLALLERFDLASGDPTSVESLHLLAEAQRLAHADRDMWVADPAFVAVPVDGLLDDGYLKSRAALLREGEAAAAVAPGHPPGAPPGLVSAAAAEEPSTTHFTIVDADGNIACMTSSIEFGFGSHVMARGFLLNNQLTDFSFVPGAPGRKVANAVEPGKRPRSSMSPVIVFDAVTGEPLWALGSPGGARIIAYVAQVLVALLDAGRSPQEAVSLPHVVNLGGRTELEDLGWPEGVLVERVAGLRALGHDVTVGQQNSGLHVVQWTHRGLVPGIDPRREGAARGY
jgi:gamma-glutamyltranspeptidase / glutathione hydrolase